MTSRGVGCGVEGGLETSSTRPDPEFDSIRLDESEGEGESESEDAADPLSKVFNVC
jgi:hypothetical protein